MDLNLNAGQINYKKTNQMGIVDNKHHIKTRDENDVFSILHIDYSI